jgi:hypothetical protein
LGMTLMAFIERGSVYRRPGPRRCAAHRKFGSDADGFASVTEEHSDCDPANTEMLRCNLTRIGPAL